ncbi:MAG: NAD(P)/FAD-dependent oxidoreductase [Hyphomonadaceae bacterium]|nr:NAD(P)/FAD-dependent oxidoreductase [Hyphomonadaceae bacterium]
MSPLYHSRRQLLQGLAGAALLSQMALPALAQTRARLVVVGGGFGGASAAGAMKHLMPAASVTLVEASPHYYACPFSNLVIAGLRELDAQRFDYDGLTARGVEVVHDRAVDVDSIAHTVRLASGDQLAYDKLVLSPGIDFLWDAIEGYGREAVERMPHAWKAGGQTGLLRQKLEAMDDGGQVVMAIPPAPFRCPPGPYERASLIAHYLKAHKPRSRLLLLDAQDSFSKQPLFEQAWAEHYPDHLERYGAADFARVVSVDPDHMVLTTEFDDFRADVANVIPPQKAGEIAQRAGVADATGWCPIDPLSFASTLQTDIHVIGDATIAAPMPKSAFSANLQAKLCAVQIARVLGGLGPEPTILTNTCYSFISNDAAVSITGVYSNDAGRLQSVEGAGGLSPLNADPAIRTAEALQAETWFKTLTQAAFG